MQKKNVRDLVAAGLFVALGIVLPLAFHGIQGAGPIFLPMHIPVLMSGLILGWKYGLAVGVVTPILSHFLTGMPPIAPLPMLQVMIFELAAYGAVAGILIRIVRTKNTYANLYVALIGAMLVGRLVMGSLNAVWFIRGTYSLQIWLTFALFQAWPGILILLAFVPLVVFALKKSVMRNY